MALRGGDGRKPIAVGVNFGALSRATPFGIHSSIMKKVHSLLALVIVALLGCVSAGSRLERHVVDRIKEGATQRAEVEKLLGAPRSTLQGSDRKVLVDYAFGRYHPGSQPEAIGPTSRIIGSVWERSVSILYDTEGVVLKKTYFETERRIRADEDRVWTGQNISDDDLKSIEPGVTTFAEITKRFGRPSGKGLNLGGKFVYDWRYAVAKEPSGLNIKGRTIQIAFEDDGKVVDYRIHGNVPSLP